MSAQPATEQRYVGSAHKSDTRFKRLVAGIREHLLLMPAMLILFGLVIYPLFFSLGKSLTDYNLGMPGEAFIGLKNYLSAFQDKGFLASMGFGAMYSVCAVSLELLLGFATALLLRREFLGKRIVTVLLITPMMVTPVVVGIIWMLMFQPQFSVINGVLLHLGIEGPIWLQGVATARIATIIADVWQWTPFFTLVLLAGLLNLPGDILEAAQVDGASGWKTLWAIILPIMKPLILVVVLIRLIDSFKTFDSVYIMTNGGPGTSTELVSLHIYRTGLPYMNMSYASAQSFIFLIVLTIATMFLVRQLRRAE